MTNSLHRPKPVLEQTTPRRRPPDAADAAVPYSPSAGVSRPAASQTSNPAAGPRVSSLHESSLSASAGMGTGQKRSTTQGTAATSSVGREGVGTMSPPRQQSVSGETPRRSVPPANVPGGPTTASLSGRQSPPSTDRRGPISTTPGGATTPAHPADSRLHAHTHFDAKNSRFSLRSGWQAGCNMAKLLHWYCRRGTLSLFLCWIAGALLYALPRDNAGLVKQSVRDAVIPGSTALMQSGAELARHLDTSIVWIRERMADVPTVAIAPPEQIDQSQLRQLELQVAELNQKLQLARTGQLAPWERSAEKPLFVPNLLPASVIGKERSEGRRAVERLMDAGRRQGVADGDLVMEASRLEASLNETPADASPTLLLDQGAPSGVTLDQPVYAGRVVVGRVREVGQWSSTVQLVHDAEFRASAQLVRQSPQGPVLGAQGVYRGGGPDRAGQLTLIAATEPVAVGDAIYTSETIGGNEVRMLLGHVIRTDLSPGAREWTIDVRPALQQPPVKVDILTLDLHPDRLTPVETTADNSALTNTPRTATTADQFNTSR
ncbi:MAG: rod shape-determining protein MreC [Planctomycetaceae bacterium]